MINWRAPCKPAPNDYFVAIYQVPPNRLKFGMPTLFVLKNVPVFFFPQAGKQGFKHILESSPPPPLSCTPPPPPSISLQYRKRHMHSVLALKDRNSTLFGDEQRGGGGGGWIWHNFVHMFLHSWKKTTGTFFNTKRVDMPNFSRFGATWKITMK